MYTYFWVILIFSFDFPTLWLEKIYTYTIYYVWCVCVCVEIHISKTSKTIYIVRFDPEHLSSVKIALGS